MQSDEITRAEAARILGISDTQIRRLESDKRLRPVRADARGAIYHSRSAVEAYAERQADASARRKRLRASGAPAPADRAATEPVVVDGAAMRAIFAAFRAGRDLASIVEETGVDPARVRDLHAQFVTPLAAAFPTDAPARAPRATPEDDLRLDRDHAATMRAIDAEEATRARQFESDMRASQARRDAIRAEQDRLLQERNDRAAERRASLRYAAGEAPQSVDEGAPARRPRR